MKSNIDTIIESLVDLHVPTASGSRQRHLFRESLRALVRLAQSQQIMEIKSSVRKLSGVTQEDHNGPNAYAALRARNGSSSQGQLEFEPASTCVRQDVQAKP